MRDRHEVKKPEQHLLKVVGPAQQVLPECCVGRVLPEYCVGRGTARVLRGTGYCQSTAWDGVTALGWGGSVAGTVNGNITAF